MRRVLASILIAGLAACTEPVPSPVEPDAAQGQEPTPDASDEPTPSPDAATPPPDAEPEPDGGEPPPPPAKANLVLKDPLRDFGSITVNRISAAFATELTNTGEGDAQALRFALSGAARNDFIVQSPCAGQTVEAGAKCALSLRFVPRQEGLRSATLTISGENAANPVTFLLSGIGVDNGAMVLSPTGLDFDTVAIGTTATARTITITNRRAVTLPKPAITVSEKTFAVPGNTCTAALPSGATCSLTVTFSPQVGGPAVAQLTVTAGTESSDVTLTGDGSGRLEVKRNGTGLGTVTGTGINCGTGCTTTVAARDLTLKAVATSGSRFAGWSLDSCEGDTCVVPIDGASRVVTATFNRIIVLRKLTVEIGRNSVMGGGGKVTVSGEANCAFSRADKQTCTYNIDSEEEVVLTAKPNRCSQIVWNGACESRPIDSPTCRLKMTVARTVGVGFISSRSCVP